MKTPLFSAVEEYMKRDMARFHMPGHKGRGEGIFSKISPYDVTEVPGLDSLFHADGPILKLEQELARIWNARHTLLSAGGATLCIQTMLALACPPGSKLICSRNIHRSALNTMALLDLHPLWVYPKNDAGNGFTGRYAPADIESMLAATPDAAAVYITSPDYFGVMSDLEGIAKVCKAHHVPLLVDNAHGAHLRLLGNSLHPMDCDASMCADSLHKTLPAMTGGALLHIADKQYIPDAKRVMSLFASTSPSYPIMLSCEQAAAYADSAEARAQFAVLKEQLDALKIQAAQKSFALPQGNCDPAKLTLGFMPFGIQSDEFGAYLSRFGIEPELLTNTACVLMATPQNSADDFARLQGAIEAVPWQAAKESAVAVLLPKLRQAMPVREAAFSPQELIPVEHATGRIAAGECSPCPPGIPVVMSGEAIEKETVELLLQLGVSRISVVQD